MHSGNRKVSRTQKAKIFSRFAHVGIDIDAYDEIFSDFDPRPFSERTVSEDFLKHLRRHFYDRKPAYLDLVILVPHKKRKNTLENTIKKRLHIYFHQSLREVTAEIRGVTKRNIFITIFALLLMVAGGFLSAKTIKSIYDYMLITFIEPASWFLFWTSLETLLQTRKKYKMELLYYKQLADCKIVFYSV